MAGLRGIKPENLLQFIRCWFYWFSIPPITQGQGSPPTKIHQRRAIFTADFRTNFLLQRSSAYRIVRYRSKIEA